MRSLKFQESASDIYVDEIGSDRSSSSTSGYESLESVHGNLPNITDAERIELLGSGSFGQVWRVKYLGAEEAWKYISLERSRRDSVRNEVHNIRRVTHQNIVTCHGFIEAPNVNYFIVRMEYIGGNNLWDKVEANGVLTEAETLKIGMQIASGLVAAHSKGVIHQDLKPQNVIETCNRKRVVVGDFGISASIKDAGVVKGSIYFMSPEQKIGKKPSPSHDLWSLGITMLYLMTGHMPYKRVESNKIELVTKDGKVDVKRFAPMISPAFGELLGRILTVNQETRLDGLKNVIDGMNRALDELSSRPRLERARSLFSKAEYSDFIKLLREEIVEEGSNDELIGLMRTAEVRRNDLANALRVIETQIEVGQLAGALKMLRKAEDDHLGSDSLRQLRDRLFERIIEDWKAWKGNIQSALQAGEFAVCENLLNDADKYLDDRDVVRKLCGNTATLRSDRRRLMRRVNYFRHTANQSKEDYKRLVEAFESSLRSLVMKRSIELAHQLSTRYPGSDMLRGRLESVRKAHALLADLDADLPKKLQKIIPGGLGENTRIAPVETLSRIRETNRILSDLPGAPVNNGDRDKLCILGRSLEKELNHLRERMKECIEKAEAFAAKRRLNEALDLLRPVQSLIFKSDIVDSSLSKRIMNMIGELEEKKERAAQHLQSGLKALEKKDYQQAYEDFRISQNLIPGDECDVLLKEADKERKVQLGNRQAFNNLMSRYSSTESMVSGPTDFQMQEDMRGYLEQIFQLLARWDDWDDPARRMEILHALDRLLGLYGESAAVHKQPDIVLERLSNLSGLLETVPDSLFPANCSQQENDLEHDLCRSLEAMIRCTAECLENEADLAVATRWIESFSEEVVRIKSFIDMQRVGLGQDPPLLSFSCAVSKVLDRALTDQADNSILVRIRRILKTLNYSTEEPRTRYAGEAAFKKCTRRLRMHRLKRSAKKVAYAALVTVSVAGILLAGYKYGSDVHHPRTDWAEEIYLLASGIQVDALPGKNDYKLYTWDIASFGRTAGLLMEINRYREQFHNPQTGDYDARLRRLSNLVMRLGNEDKWHIDAGRVKPGSPARMWFNILKTRYEKELLTAVKEWEYSLAEEVANTINQCDNLAKACLALNLAYDRYWKMKNALILMPKDSKLGQVLEDLKTRTRFNIDRSKGEKWVLERKDRDSLNEAVRMLVTNHCINERREELRDTKGNVENPEEWLRTFYGLIAINQGVNP